MERKVRAFLNNVGDVTYGIEHSMAIARTLSLTDNTDSKIEFLCKHAYINTMAVKSYVKIWNKAHAKPRLGMENDTDDPLAQVAGMSGFSPNELDIMSNTRFIKICNTYREVLRGQ